MIIIIYQLFAHRHSPLSRPSTYIVYGDFKHLSKTKFKVERHLWMRVKQVKAYTTSSGMHIIFSWVRVTNPLMPPLPLRTPMLHRWPYNCWHHSRLLSTAIWSGLWPRTETDEHNYRPRPTWLCVGVLDLHAMMRSFLNNVFSKFWSDSLLKFWTTPNSHPAYY